MEKRYFPYVILLVAMLGAMSAGRARAQNGFCPPNSTAVGVPADTGAYIDDFCSYDTGTMNIGTDHDGWYLCLQHMLVLADSGTNTSPVEYVPVVQAADRWLSESAHIRFYVHTLPDTQWGGFLPPGYDFHDEDTIIVEYFDQWGNLYSTHETPVNYHWYMMLYQVNDLGITQYFNVYFVDIYLNMLSGYGGYFRIGIEQPDIVEDGDTYHPTRDWAISSLRIGSMYDYLEPMCSADSLPTPQPTPSPQPSPTPPIVATWTPNGTPIPTPVTTPQPTSVFVSPQPSPTMTPIVYPTLHAEATATAWPVPQLQPVTWPTISIPTLAAINTPPPIAVTVDTTVTAAERATVSWGMADDAVDIATAWADQIEFSLGELDPGRAITNTITGTETISSTAGGFAATLQSVTYPIRFVKMIRQYMPNGWILLSVVLIAFFLIFGLVVVRLAVTIIGEVVGIIRDLWEAIPLN